MVSKNKIEDMGNKICNYLYLKHALFIEISKPKHKRNTIAFNVFSYKSNLIGTIKDIFKQEYGKDVTIINGYIVYFTYDELLEFYTILKIKGEI